MIDFRGPRLLEPADHPRRRNHLNQLYHDDALNSVNEVRR